MYGVKQQLDDAQKKIQTLESDRITFKDVLRKRNAQLATLHREFEKKGVPNLVETLLQESAKLKSLLNQLDNVIEDSKYQKDSSGTSSPVEKLLHQTFIIKEGLVKRDRLLAQFEQENKGSVAPNTYK